MRNLSFAAVLWVAVFVGVGLSAQTKPEKPATSEKSAKSEKSASQGVYTEAQATRGAAVFKTACVACHDEARFIGPDFLGMWTGKPLHGLFNHVATMMPEDNPGSLKPQQYADVIAFMLKLNGYPEGKEELPATPDAMKTISFDKKVK